MGPPVVTVQAISGFVIDRANGERPRCAAPSRNIACAVSSAYCGSAGAAVDDAPPGVAGAIPARAPCGQTHLPASHTRSILQSLSAPHPSSPSPKCAQAPEARLESNRARAAKEGPRSSGARSRRGANHERNELLMRMGRRLGQNEKHARPRPWRRCRPILVWWRNVRSASSPALCLLLTSAILAGACRHETSRVAAVPAPPVAAPAPAPPTPVAAPLSAKLGRAAIRHVVIVSED